MDLLDIEGNSSSSVSSEEVKGQIEAATAAAKALWTLCYSAAARRELYLAGGIPLLTQLAITVHSTVHAPADNRSTKLKYCITVYYHLLLLWNESIRFNSFCLQDFT